MNANGSPPNDFNFDGDTIVTIKIDSMSSYDLEKYLEKENPEIETDKEENNL